MQLKALKDYDAIELKPETRGTFHDPNAIQDHAERTSGKDTTAEWVEENIVAKDRWPMGAKNIADELEADPNYDGPKSRQHVTNVLEGYYQPADGNGVGDPTTDGSPMSASPEQPYSANSETNAETADAETTTETILVRGKERMREVTIEVPADVDSSSYVRGYLDCRMELTTFTEAE